MALGRMEPVALTALCSGQRPGHGTAWAAFAPRTEPTVVTTDLLVSPSQGQLGRDRWVLWVLQVSALRR